jgi:hypothetical protein
LSERGRMQEQVTTRRRFCPWVFLVLICMIWPGWSGAQYNTASNQNTSDNPPSRVARLSYLKGNVSFLRAGMTQWSQAAMNFPATTGDRIYTDEGARAELEVGPFAVRMASKTDLTITNLSDQIMQLGLQQGTLRLSIYKLDNGDSVEVDTPNGALTVLDPGNYRVDTDADGNSTVVTVNRGRLEITGGGVDQTLEAGTAARLTGSDSIQVESIPIPLPDSFDAWSEERDRRLRDSGSAKYVSSSTPGFEDLDEYGHWSEVVDYGPVWYPPVAVGWVPYRVGHWAWVDPWGWSWVEDEPWGFCSFHFGRWAFIGAAWGWIPGPIIAAPVYAPGLVAFLGGPGFSIGVGVGLVGWFPLGPREPFFPWYHYGGNYLNVVNITNIRNVTNITNITNVTNTNNIHYQYQNIATTAVSKNAFSSGQPVARQMVHLTPQQLAKAQVIPHPAVNPSPRAAAPGKPVETPPVRSHPLVANRANQAAMRPASDAKLPSPASTRPNTQPRANTAQRVPPPRHPVTTSPPRLITRATPPPMPPSFASTREAMMEHPGRPLEPPQLDNLRAGRPAGPMIDRESPPHPFPVVRERPMPRPPPVARHPR